MLLLEQLKGLNHLDWLKVDLANVTDASLDHLMGLNTRWLFLRYTKVTDDGVKKLQQALPNCKIER